MRASSVGRCRHCGRAVLRVGLVWLHTDLQAVCLCPWRVARTGTVAEPTVPPEPPRPVPVVRRRYATPAAADRVRVCDPDCWCRGKPIAGAA